MSAFYWFRRVLGLVITATIAIYPIPPNVIQSLEVERSPGNPLIAPDRDHPGDGAQGHTVIRVPSWIKNPLGKYFMYYSKHGGNQSFVRLAYSDDLDGPWKIHKPDVVSGGHLHQTDILLIPEERRMILYVHAGKTSWGGIFVHFESSDGIQFKSLGPVEGGHQGRLFSWRNRLFSISKFSSSSQSIRQYTTLKTMRVLKSDVLGSGRHFGLSRQGRQLLIFYSMRGDTPERIKVSTMDLSLPPPLWQPSAAKEVLRPKYPYEGSEYKIGKSGGGGAHHVHQVRDPFIFEENDSLYLFYSLMGEHGIGMARLTIDLNEKDTVISASEGCSKNPFDKSSDLNKWQKTSDASVILENGGIRVEPSPDGNEQWQFSGLTRKISGDFDMRMEIKNTSGNNSNTIAGFMIGNDLTSGEGNGFLVGKGKGVHVKYTNKKNRWANAESPVPNNKNLEIRLIREGDWFSSFYRELGAPFWTGPIQMSTRIYQEMNNLGKEVEIGIGITRFSGSTQALANFDNFSLNPWLFPCTEKSDVPVALRSENRYRMPEGDRKFTQAFEGTQHAPFPLFTQNSAMQRGRPILYDAKGKSLRILGWGSLNDP